MILSKPAFLLLLVFLLGNAGFVLAQTGEGDTVPPQIINPDTVPVPYCSDSIPVAPNITIQNIKIDESDEGMKVSIANYRRGEDKLVYEVVDKFKDGYTWNNVKGELEIRGVGTVEEYRSAISKVYYKNIAETPTLGIRTFSISLVDADYLPSTKHFYRYIKDRGIKWTEARDSAANMNYYGLTGYLATITSVQENDFIWTKIEGVGWIGANDSLVEGKWQWETGPEKGTHFWQGTYQNGYKVNGRYSNWNSGEPNNVRKSWGDDEDYAHINADPNSVQKSWNDLPNDGDRETPNGYYFPEGFIVEFGGMDGDPPVKLSATASIEVAKIAFSDIREYTICQGESQLLNLDADDAYSYSWTPTNDMNNPNASNPIVFPKVYTVYTAIGRLKDLCRDTADFKVYVNSLPISLLDTLTVYCKGSSIELNAGKHTSYLWSTGDTTQTIAVNDENKYWVRLTNEHDCELVDTVDVKWSVRPELDYSTVDTLVCGPKYQTLSLSFVGVTASTNLISLDSLAIVGDETSLTPTISVTEFGKYKFKMEIEDEYGCQFLDTLNIEFHNQPEAKFLMDSTECKGYSLELTFDGSTKEDALFTWFYNDTIFGSGVNVFDTIIPLGYGELNRTVGLKVNEQGCIDSSMQNVTVTPNIDIIATNKEGCTPLLVEFEAKSTELVQSYLWDFGDGNSSNDKITSNNYINTETIDLVFDVGLTVVSTEGCENTGVLDGLVVVHPKPTVDFSFSEDDCNPVQMEIWYEGSGSEADTYSWDLSAFKTDEILQNPGITQGPFEILRSSEPTANVGIHVVTEFGCNSDTIVKQWKRKPNFNVLVDTTEGCPPLSVLANSVVLDSVDNVNFTYDLGDGTTGSDNTVAYIFAVPNTKNVIQFTGTSSLTGCAETVVYKDTIHVYPVPEAAFIPIPEAVLVSDPEIEFENNTIGASSYEWDFGDLSNISYEYSPVHRYAGMGFYDVSLFTFNDLGCLDSTSSRVSVAFDKLFPPNAFSPNALLEENREFRIYSDGVADEGYQLLIFNRWGQVTFESNSQQNGWDGKMKNDSFAPAGVYTWVLQYTDFRGEKHKQQGSVTLVF